METVLYSFTGPNDGVNPCSGVIRNSGNLSGTTSGGGPNKGGTIFKLAKNGKLTVLYSFPGTNGSHPNAGLIRDSAGNLYGTAMDGGDHGSGVVFKITP
jgi:uncharacterized repeat protein (TIGR03803 family)